MTAKMIGMKSKFYLPKGILFITIPQHVFGFLVPLYLIIFGKASAIWLLYSYISWVLLGVVGIGIFYHKYLAHRSFQTYFPIEAIGTYLGCMAGLGAPIGWVALHNDHHHKYADKNDLDVHSPIHGKFRAYLGWQFYTFDLKINSAKKLLKSRWLRFLGKYYFQVYWGSVLVLFAVNPLLPVF